MIDLHCHLLPGIDDGPSDVATSLRMARMSVADGVEVVACTPHILPGVFHNTGPAIQAATQNLQNVLDQEGVALRLISGSDAHITPTMVGQLNAGQILTLGGSRYVLVEPPHHVAPVQLEEFFFSLVVAGYAPILTHPERLSWIKGNYDVVRRLFQAGVWMQITAGSLLGTFGRQPLYWAERMLDEGMVHVLASDAHEAERRTPVLSKGVQVAAKRVGDQEAMHMVVTRPRGVVAKARPSDLPSPIQQSLGSGDRYAGKHFAGGSDRRRPGQGSVAGDGGGHRGITGRLRQFFGA